MQFANDCCFFSLQNLDLGTKNSGERFWITRTNLSIIVGVIFAIILLAITSFTDLFFAGIMPLLQHS